jgi:hypothetical protein
LEDVRLIGDQIYEAEAKLAIDVKAVHVEASDFTRAIHNLTPAQQVFLRKGVVWGFL